MCDFNFNFVRI